MVQCRENVNGNDAVLISVWHGRGVCCTKCCCSSCLFNSLLHFARVIDDAKCIVVMAVCMSVCVSVHCRMPTLLHGPGCNLGEW